MAEQKWPVESGDLDRPPRMVGRLRLHDWMTSLPCFVAMLLGMLHLAGSLSLSSVFRVKHYVTS